MNEIIEKLFNYNNSLNETANSKLLEKYNEIINSFFIHFIPAVRFDSALFLRMISLLKQPEQILEIGFGSGVSSYFISNGISINHKLITIERDNERYERGLKVIDKFNMQSVELIKDDAFSFIDNDNSLYDLIFVDAGKNDYSKYLDIVKNKIKTGGLLICDNTFFNGNVVKDESDIIKRHKKPADLMKSFNNYLADMKCFETNYYMIGDGMSLSIKK